MPTTAYPAVASTYRLRSESEATAPVPYGCCQCGCGHRTALARDTSAQRGDVRGEPVKYLPGHRTRLRANYREQDCGYSSACWVWLGRTTSGGYARVSSIGLMHRWAYERQNGPIPTGLDIDHLCRNRACVNPAHMEPVPSKTNVRRGISGRRLGFEGAFLIRTLAVSTALTKADIAEMLGVSRKTVFNVIRGDTWAPD